MLVQLLLESNSGGGGKGGGTFMPEGINFVLPANLV